jgi:hypothetical protein
LALRRDGDTGWEGLPLLDRTMPLLAGALQQAWPQRYAHHPTHTSPP